MYLKSANNISSFAHWQYGPISLWSCYNYIETAFALVKWREGWGWDWDTALWNFTALQVYVYLIAEGLCVRQLTLLCISFCICTHVCMSIMLIFCTQCAHAAALLLLASQVKLNEHGGSILWERQIITSNWAIWRIIVWVPCIWHQWGDQRVWGVLQSQYLYHMVPS